MSREVTDKTGATAVIDVELAAPISAYTVSLDGTKVGEADFIDSADVNERIFFHTEVGDEFEGRGLGGLLVKEALAGSIRDNRTVVPVCPLFGSHLKKHGEEFRADGGQFREPTSADTAQVENATRGGS